MVAPTGQGCQEAWILTSVLPQTYQDVLQVFHPLTHGFLIC